MRQRTKKWLNLKKKRIGSSEIFSLVKYYATDEELLNCSLSPQEVADETAFDSAWTLYHKIKQDITIHTKQLPISLDKYGISMEDYAMNFLKDNFKGITFKKGNVYIPDNFRIASLDIECNVKSSILRDVSGQIINTFKNYKGLVEVKTVNKYKWLNNGISCRTKIQQAYQMYCTGIKFGGIVSIVLKDDTQEKRAFLAGIFEADKTKFLNYAKDEISEVFVDWYQFNNAFIGLFSSVLERFKRDLNEDNCPALFIGDEEPKVIFDAIREFQEKTHTSIGSCEIDLKGYIKAKNLLKKVDDIFKLKKNAIINKLYFEKSIEAQDIKNNVFLKIDARNALVVKDMK